MDIFKDIRSQPTWDLAIRTAVAGVKAMKPYYDWVGVYMLEGDMLTLRDEHYSGLPTEHTRIPLDSGICGAGAAEKETLVIDDVSADPRYIACSLTVKSEIVVPIMVADRVIGVLDLDSDTPAAFTADDRRELEQVAAALAQVWERAGNEKP
ncbi:MAG: GAF domain-containing protein [Fidelibacterota bacterium]|nr:MAG: GAF domain-containing protein [Candidatus Neomarinimicrobiota bacterium]